MRVTCFEIGPMPTNCYVVDNGREALCVDPGGDPAPVMDFLKKEGLQLLAILLTHRHFDHMLGIAALQKALEVPCLVPAGDSVIKDEQMKQIRDLQDFVKKQPATITEFDETLVKRLIAKITVFEDLFTVDFKSGLTIDIEI